MLQCIQTMLQGCRRCCRRCAGDAAKDVQAMLPKMCRRCCRGAGYAAKDVQAMLPKMCRLCCQRCAGDAAMYAGCAAGGVQAMLPKMCRLCCQRCAGDAAEVQAVLPKMCRRCCRSAGDAAEMWLLCLCCQRLDVVVIPWNSRECHCENVYCLMPIVIHSGPFHHNVEFANIVGSAPREMRSAGLC